MRAAIDESNGWPFADTITIAGGVNPTLAIAGAQENLNRTGDLDILDSVSIVGGGATVDGGQLDSVFEQFLGTTTISGLTVRGAGVVFNDSATAGIRVRPSATSMTVQASTVTGNQRSGIRSSAPLTVTTSSVTANNGAGIIGDYSSTTTIDRTTVSGNATSAVILYGPATITLSTLIATTASAVDVFGSGTVAVTASTLASNSTSGTIRNSGGTASMVVKGSAFNGIGGVACAGAVSSGGYNRWSQGGCAFAQVGDLKVPDIGLGHLAANGGPTRTRLPNAGSTVLEVIPAGTVGPCDATLPIDQRGQARPQGTACDVGAVERTL